MHIMFRSVLIIIFLGFCSFLLGQVESANYTSYQAIEYKHSYASHELEVIRTVDEISYFNFNADYILFKKYDQNWLSNKWTYDGAHYYREIENDSYIDDRNQMILINYTNHEIWYFWNYDNYLDKYLNLTVYKDIYKTSGNKSKASEDGLLVLKTDERYVAELNDRVKKWNIIAHDANDPSTFTFSSDFLKFEHKTLSKTSNYIINNYNHNTDKQRHEFDIISDTGRSYTMVWDEVGDSVRFVYKDDSGTTNQVRYTIASSHYDNSKNKLSFETNKWMGNGSGFFIHENGYLATNYHVIQDANEIEVEFVSNNQKKIYKAIVVNKDIANDLAILKIEDASFEVMKNIPYGFQASSEDVGSEVFALGYPMALSLMGDEIKFTDGKVSSQSGYMGAEHVYQTTTPIQPGNSGGPLFDNQGNLIGINVSKIQNKDVDNVSYSVKYKYLENLIHKSFKKINMPNRSNISHLPLTDQIKVLSNYVVMIKVR